MKINVNFINNGNRTKVLVITLLFCYIVWLFSVNGLLMTYDLLRMDTFGTFDHFSFLFWIALLLCIIISLFYTRNNTTQFLAILILALFTIGTLTVIQQFGTLHDSFYNLISSFDFMDKGSIILSNGPRENYPTGYFFWGFLHEISGLSFEYILKFNALLMVFFYILAFYLLSTSFFKNKEFFLYNIIFILLFGSRFDLRFNISPQTIAFIISIFLFALCFKDDIRYSILQFILVLFIITSHALTGFYISLVIFSFISSNIFYIFYLKYYKKTNEQNIKPFNLVITLIFCVILLFGWFAYAGGYYFYSAVTVGRDFVDALVFQNTQLNSSLQRLYELNNPTIQMVISNYMGWLLLLVVFSIIVLAFYVMYKNNQIKWLSYLAIWLGIILVNTIIFSFSTRFGLIIDRWFNFMIIPISLAVSYFLHILINKPKQVFQIPKLLSLSILCLLIILGLGTILTSHYPDNFSIITQTEISAQQFNQLQPRMENYWFLYVDNKYFPTFIERKQTIDDKIILISSQIMNFRIYAEADKDNSVKKLEQEIQSDQIHNLLYNNGNNKNYSSLY
jgi:hypothetical protein